MLTIPSLACVDPYHLKRVTFKLLLCCCCCCCCGAHDHWESYFAFSIIFVTFLPRGQKKAFSVVVVSNVVVVVVLLWSVRSTTLFHAHWKFAFISYASSDRTIGRPPDLPNRFSVLEVFAKFLVFL